jgi:squalene-hopene/tetraprenyl-beta-curcumene cyclase
VVSYALPALIAIGQARHHHRPTHNPLMRCLRSLACEKTLRRLETIQPHSGGFLEAPPLTGFVLMSLASIGQGDHPVARQAAAFLATSVREDGSWPIDTNLAMWVTTLSVAALASGQNLAAHLSIDERAGLRRWLLDLQNKDGGVPTFCRGWGKLPFDRSTPDLTAHALRAWNAWREYVAQDLRTRIDRATLAAVRYLSSVQRRDGAWIPLWFGNQGDSAQENPLYGTTRVLRAGRAVLNDRPTSDVWRRALRRGILWVLETQNQDGGWGGSASPPSSIEETALAVEALADVAMIRENKSVHPEADESPTPNAGPANIKPTADAIRRGVSWLVEQTDCGTHFPPAPIGLYFARLWYAERLYPLIFTVSALERVCCSREKSRPS